jgi:hypothetical protein
MITGTFVTANNGNKVNNYTFLNRNDISNNWLFESPS